MKAIILSAGKGERLLPLTKDRPKILVELGDGTTMFSRQYDSFCNHKNINEIVIGAGYCVEKVEEYISEITGPLKATVIYNPFFAVSGPLVTLWIALNKVNDSNFIFLNGDTIFSQTFHDRINEIIKSKRNGIYLFCSHKNDFSADDVILKISDKRILKAGKKIKGGNAVSAGLMMVIGESCSAGFREALDRVARRDDFLNYNKTWHSFINDLVELDIKVEPVITDISDWVEVDLHFELEDLQKILTNKLKLEI